MILLAKELEKFGISAAEIEQKEKGLYVPFISVGPECVICFNQLKDPETLVEILKGRLCSGFIRY